MLRVAIQYDGIESSGAHQLLSNVLNSLANRDCHLTLIHMDKGEAMEGADDVRIENRWGYIPYKLCLDRQAIRDITDTYMRNDAIICFFVQGLMAASWARRRGYRGKVIFVHQFFTPLEQYATLGWSYLGMLYPLFGKMMIKRYVSSADSVVVCSQFLQQQTQLEYGITPIVIPWGVNTELYNPNVPQGKVLSQFGLGKDDFVILYVGRLNPIKRIDVLIDMVGLLKGRMPIRLLVVGEDQGIKSELMRKASDLGVSREVIFVGPIPFTELPEYYVDSSLFATASSYEGFCLPILEAYACGRTVVASNCTAFPETVGDAGILCRPRDPRSFAEATYSLWKDPDKRIELERKAPNRAKEFTWDAFGEKIYHSISE